MKRRGIILALLAAALGLALAGCTAEPVSAETAPATTAVTTTETTQRSTVLFTTQAQPEARTEKAAELPTGAVRPGDTPSPVRVNAKYRVATQGSDLRMRAGPSPDYPTAGAIPSGEVVTVSYSYNRWGYVNYKGTEGWCFMEYLESEWYDFGDYDCDYGC